MRTIAENGRERRRAAAEVAVRKREPIRHSRKSGVSAKMLDLILLNLVTRYM